MWQSHDHPIAGSIWRYLSRSVRFANALSLFRALLQTLFETVFECVVEGHSTRERTLELQDSLIASSQTGRKTGYRRFRIPEACSPVIN